MSEFANAPVGLWSGTVAYDGKKDDYTIGFSENGSVDLTTLESTGAGTWTMTGDGAFTYTVKEVFTVDEAGAPPEKVLPGAAYVQIDISAQHTGSTFTGSGIAHVRGADGRVIHSTLAKTVAHRVPTS
ncbi:hypothetical protein [Geodermatophilus sp. SYSU D01176]